jgi:hypothetical protein
MRRSMRVFKALSSTIRNAVRHVCGVLIGKDIQGIIEHSFVLPILFRYGMGFEWEFAEYSIFRVLRATALGRKKSSSLRGEG